MDYLLATQTGEYILEAVRWLGWLPLVAAYLWLRERLDAAPRAYRPRLTERLPRASPPSTTAACAPSSPSPLGLCLSLTAEAQAQAPTASNDMAYCAELSALVSPLPRQYRRGQDVSRRHGGERRYPSASGATRRPAFPCWRRSCATRASPCPSAADQRRVACSESASGSQACPASASRRRPSSPASGTCATAPGRARAASRA